MTKVFSADYLRSFGTDFFTACGSPREEAFLVADHLVESNLMGYDSHGMARCPEYLVCIGDGRVKPGAPITVIKESPSTAIVDCGMNYGQVGMNAIMEIGCEKAKHCGISCVLSKNSFHAGRLGAYVEKIANRGMVSMLSCNSRKKFHVLVPWGGRDGRLGTNPFAFGAPTNRWPVVMDMSTCMIAAGKINIAILEGKNLPEGCIQDPDGNPTTDPKTFYGPNGECLGTILPLGSPRFGHKGYGLAMMMDILGGILGGDDSTVDHVRSNGLSLIVINPDFFCGMDLFRELVDRFCAYQMSSRPARGFKEVVVPGTYDFRLREKRLAEGIPIDDRIWQQIVDAADSVGACQKTNH